MNRNQANQAGRSGQTGQADQANRQILKQATLSLAGSFQAAALVAVLAAGGTAAQAQQAATVSDADLATAVRTALAADLQLRGQQITATSARGVVTLSGTVADDAQRTAAEQTVAQVKGVQSIEDSISVAGAPASSVPSQPATGQPVQAAGAPGQPNPADMPPPPPDDVTQEQGPSQQDGQYAPQMGQYPQQSPQNQQNTGQYPPSQPGQYSPYPPQQRGPYAPMPRPQPSIFGVPPEKQDGSGPVTLNAGLLLNVRSLEPLSTSALKPGQFVQFTAASAVFVNGVIAIPRGAVFTGQVIESRSAGALGGSPRLELKLTTLSLGSQTYPLVSDVWSSQGPGKGGYTASNTVEGAAFGAIIGAVAGGGIGAGVGALAGGAGGVLVSGATHGPRLDLPVEALLQFHLTAPLTVQPVKYDEAERLAASMPEQPVLHARPVYMRRAYPYNPGAYFPRPFYPYPSVYYYGRF